MGPQFLHMICLLVTGNVLGLNDAADKVLKREVRTQEFLKKVTASDGSKRGRRRRSSLCALQAASNVASAAGDGAKRGSMLMTPTNSGGGRHSSIATFEGGGKRGSTLMTPTNSGGRHEKRATDFSQIAHARTVLGRARGSMAEIRE